MDFYGTLGPSCQEESVLYDMFQMGMTGLRLNLSHKPLAACSDWIDQMQQAAAPQPVQPVQPVAAPEKKHDDVDIESMMAELAALRAQLAEKNENNT